MAGNHGGGMKNASQGWQLLLAFSVTRSYGEVGEAFRARVAGPRTGSQTQRPGRRRTPMRRTLLILGLMGLAIGLLWIGQGTGTVAWPRSSFMINEIQWAGYGAALSAVGLILIWQSQRP